MNSIHKISCLLLVLLCGCTTPIVITVLDDAHNPIQSAVIVTYESKTIGITKCKKRVYITDTNGQAIISADFGRAYIGSSGYFPQSLARYPIVLSHSNAASVVLSSTSYDKRFAVFASEYLCWKCDGYSSLRRVDSPYWTNLFLYLEQLERKGYFDNVQRFTKGGEGGAGSGD